jgi:hypothetical protein
MGVRALSRSGVPNDRNPINFYADDGLVYKGLVPRRPDDKIGIAAMFAPRQQCAWARCRFCIFFGQSVVSGVQQRDRDRDGCIKRRSNRGGCCNRICNTSSIPAGACSTPMAASEGTRWSSAFAHLSVSERTAPRGARLPRLFGEDDFRSFHHIARMAEVANDANAVRRPVQQDEIGRPPHRIAWI